VIESFPLGALTDGLTATDFQTLSGAFATIVSRAIPGKPAVSFPTSAADITNKKRNDKRFAKRLVELHRQLSTGEESGILFENMLLLALPLKDGGRRVALAVDLDAMVTMLASADWLRELAARLPAELLVAKRLWLDHETGLPNLACLRADMAALKKNDESDKNRRLLLVEAPPLATGRDGFAQAVAIADALCAFCRDARLFHLGQCLFAVFSEGDRRQRPTERPIERLAADLVWYLKNEGFHRVRVGASGTSASGAAARPEASLLDRSWTALRQARRRGSFGFCDFSALALAPTAWRPNSKLLARFPSHTFFAALALTVSSEAREESLGFLRETYQNIAVDGRAGHILIFLDGSDGDQARQWARTMLATLMARVSQARPHIGVAVHPQDSQESLGAVVAKAIKAARHAVFYGDGGIALFDAVTCNIAGDVDFADGNLPHAIKEYRAGLALEPDNANLLNSLGVALAMLDKNGEATRCFQRALVAEANNYMALCNLGFIAQSQNRPDEAIGFFAQALPLAAEQNEQRLAQDLRFYLGRLYCRSGRHQKAKEILTVWQNLDESLGTDERRPAWRYLGQALAGAGENRQAMAALSRAVAAHPGDHEAMSLLGELIMLLDEGNDIALSLCRKSLELAPSSPLYRLRLAEAEYRLGDLSAALAHCPRPGRRKTELDQRIASLLTAIYRQMGETKKAALWTARW